MRLGVYGGSFDPLHIGHLLLADSARVEQRLDRVVFVPIGVPPHQKTVRTSGTQRLSMLLAALEPYPEFCVDRYEIDSARVSYTVDTLRFFRERYPKDELFLILSSETFNDLPHWRDPAEICRYASIIVAKRAGYPAPDFEAMRPFVSDAQIDEFRSQLITMPLMEVSSSLIRERVAKGEGIRFLAPDSVVDYIIANRLYQN